MKELQSYASMISQVLPGQIEAWLRDVGHINSFAHQLELRLKDYALRGKLIRGSLVMFSHDLLSGTASSQETLCQVSCAMELFQSMLLIHDDIMDQDETRRGKPSIHRQYMDDGNALGLVDSLHYGESLGLCAGDVSAFVAFGIIAKLDVDEEIRRKLLEFISKEMILVGVAQMQDVYHGVVSAQKLTVEDVMRMYRYKTGRYTFSLPLSLGALLKDKDAALRTLLEELGELLGIIFQMKDDEIGLFGDEAQTGKPKASDLREGKKTVYIQLLYESLDEKEQVLLSEILEGDVNENHIQWIFERLDNFAIRQKVEAQLEDLAARCLNYIAELQQTEPRLANGMNMLLQYNLKREF